jgi:uracil-DNA glycosylase
MKSNRLDQHVAALRSCTLCPGMQRPPVSGGAVRSKVMLVGQAPGSKEPLVGRPFAWTAGRTLFGWFEKFCGMDEPAFRQSIYMAAVCRCFPGKGTGGGDRVPNQMEIQNCRGWMNAELKILKPALVIPVGKLAISQFIPVAAPLTEVIGNVYPLSHGSIRFDLIPLPHPSGASPWHRIEPGKGLVAKAMQLICNHPAFQALR